MRNIIITGGTRGIGAAIAKAVSTPDIRLTLTGTDPDEIAMRNASTPDNWNYVCADFSSSESLSNFLEYIETLESLDALVNNAGINIIKPYDDISEDEFDRLHAINLKAPYFISQTASKIMKSNEGGAIVNIASIWSVVTKTGRSLYTGAKTGLVGLTKTMAVELAPYGITVNSISPGFTLTDLTRKSLSLQEIESIATNIPMKRMADPSEIAQMVKFLCSGDNTYLTGQNLVVDGGFSIV